MKITQGLRQYKMTDPHEQYIAQIWQKKWTEKWQCKCAYQDKQTLKLLETQTWGKYIMVLDSNTFLCSVWSCLVQIRGPDILREFPRFQYTSQESVKSRTVIESKTITYLTQVSWRPGQLRKCWCLAVQKREDVREGGSICGLKHIPEAGAWSVFRSPLFHVSFHLCSHNWESCAVWKWQGKSICVSNWNKKHCKAHFAKTRQIQALIFCTNRFWKKAQERH